MDEIDTGTVSSAINALQAQGYSVRRTPGPQQREQSFAFVLHQPGMPRALVGPARSTVFAAWASAQEHAEQAEGAPATANPGPFFAAELPAAALDVSIIASRFGVDIANQFHLFVFMDRRVRMPVGFVDREVTGTAEAMAVGARQREPREGA